MESTFETKLKPTQEQAELLASQARQLSVAERRIFTQLYVAQADRNFVKSWAIATLGLTARQYNSIAYDLKGRLQAAAAASKLQVEMLCGQSSALKQKIAELEQKLSDLPLDQAAKRRHLQFVLHQKKRRLSQLQARLEQRERELKEPAPPRLCFGSRKLFHAQHHLEANGYSSHEEWRANWDFARHSNFFLIGSKDETAGNQSCQYDPAARTLKLRLTETLAREQGEKYLIFDDVSFPYGQEKIEASLERKSAVSYRFVARKEKDATVNWYIKATVAETEAELITSHERGILGVDLNADHIALGQVAADGNPLGEEKIHFDLSGKSSAQIKATLSEAVKQIVDKAVAAQVPIAIEKLDFGAKKKTLREQGKAYARMLSSFAYALFFSLLLRRAARRGVEVRCVNPAYTSVIGYVKFGAAYGLSGDGSAAIAIGRRALRMGEALATRARSPSLHTTLMEARTRSEGKHVWSGWSVVKKRLGQDRKLWPGRCPEKGVGGGRETIGRKAQTIPADSTPRAGESPAASRESCSPGAVGK